MRFEEVLPALREGKKIRRGGMVWKRYYGFLFISETENKISTNSVVRSNCDYKITKEDLKADDWEIIKEKKKVKLRDLTEVQFENWKYKNCINYDYCVGCPFQKVQCANHGRVNDAWYLNKDLYSDKFLDQEIEIEEE